MSCIHCWCCLDSQLPRQAMVLRDNHQILQTISGHAASGPPSHSLSASWICQHRAAGQASSGTDISVVRIMAASKSRNEVLDTLTTGSTDGSHFRMPAQDPSMMRGHTEMRQQAMHQQHMEAPALAARLLHGDPKQYTDSSVDMHSRGAVCKPKCQCQ